MARRFIVAAALAAALAGCALEAPEPGWQESFNFWPIAHLETRAPGREHAFSALAGLVRHDRKEGKTRFSILDLEPVGSAIAWEREGEASRLRVGSLAAGRFSLFRQEPERAGSATTWTSFLQLDWGEDPFVLLGWGMAPGWSFHPDHRFWTNFLGTVQATPFIHMDRGDGGRERYAGGGIHPLLSLVVFAGDGTFELGSFLDGWASILRTTGWQGQRGLGILAAGPPENPVAAVFSAWKDRNRAGPGGYRDERDGDSGVEVLSIRGILSLARREERDGVTRIRGIEALPALEPILPFTPALYAEDRTAEGTAARLFPLYWRRESAGSSLSLLLPFHLATRDADSEFSCWLPLTARLRVGDTDETRWLLPPFFYLERDRASGVTGFGLPWPFFARAWRDGADGRRAFAVHPLGWYDLPAGSRTSGLLPFFRSASGPGGDLLYTPLCGWRTEAAGRAGRWFALGPLVSREFDAREGSSRTDLLAGLFRFERGSGPDGPRRRDRILPFWFRSEDASGQRLHALLFHAVTDETSRRALLWPLASTVEDLDAAGFRRWTRLSLLPIADPRFLAAADRSDWEISLLWPLVRFDYGRGWLFPFVYCGYGSDKWLFYPLVGWKDGNFTVLPVLDAEFLASEDYRATFSFLWPLVRLGRDGYWVFPVFYYAERPDKWAIYPLVGSNDGRVTFFPLLDAEFAASRAYAPEFSILWPLVRFTGVRNWILPVYYRDSVGGATAVLPFFYRGPDLVPDQRRTLILGPLVGRRERAGVTETSVLWKCFVRTVAYDGLVVETRLLERLCRSRAEWGESPVRETSVPFLFRYRREGDVRTIYLLQLIPIRL